MGFLTSSTNDCGPGLAHSKWAFWLQALAIVAPIPDLANSEWVFWLQALPTMSPISGLLLDFRYTRFSVCVCAPPPLKSAENSYVHTVSGSFSAKCAPWAFQGQTTFKKHVFERFGPRMLDPGVKHTYTHHFASVLTHSYKLTIRPSPYIRSLIDSAFLERICLLSERPDITYTA